MTSTVFTDFVGPPINAAWLNDVNTSVYTTVPAISAPTGSSIVGFQLSATGAAAQTLFTKASQTVNVMDFYANGVSGVSVDPTGVVDSTLGIQAAITAAGPGGEVKFPSGVFKTTAPLNAEGLRGLTLRGSYGQYGWNGTRIIGSHTGKTILSLIGSVNCFVENISFEGDAAARPKTAILLGRSSSASAGGHNFTNVTTKGFYSVAGLYNIASEENTFINCSFAPSSASIAGVYMSQVDEFSIGGLTGSSMESNTFIGGVIGNSDNTAGSTALYLDCGASTGHHQFHGTFMYKNGGDSYIYIRLGVVDGNSSTTFPISFYNVVGEDGAASPAYGLHVFNGTAGAASLMGLTAKNIRFQTPTTYNIYVNGGTNCSLIGADISTPYKPAAIGSNINTLQGSRVSMLYENALTVSLSIGNDYLVGCVPSIASELGGSTIRNFAGPTYSMPAITGALIESQILPSYGTTVAINCALGNQFLIGTTDGTAFTIQNPTNPKQGQRITIAVRNGGGVMGVITWGTLYKISGWVNPANGFNRSADFIYNGANWQLVSLITTDVPN